MRRRIVVVGGAEEPRVAFCWMCDAGTAANEWGLPTDTSWHVGEGPTGKPVISCPKHRPKSATTLGDLLRAKGQHL
jgi:hypothetical protein